MSNLIASGKDSVTGQQRIAGPNDELIDSSGGVMGGGGAFAPITGATESVISGAGHTTQYLGYYPDYSFIQGYGCTSYTNYSFVHGLNCTSSGYGGTAGFGGNFVQGYNCSANNYANFVQGLNNSQNGWNGFAQGNNCSIVGNNGLAQGYNCDIAGNNGLVQGDICNVTGDNGFAQGDVCNVTGNNGFVQGNKCYVVGDSSFAQGYNNSVDGLSFAQGKNMMSGYASFSQGYGYGSYNGAVGSYSFAQGAGVLAAGDYSFAQGGWYCQTTSDVVMAQGLDVVQSGASLGPSFLQGKALSVTGITSIANKAGLFLQGHTISFTGSKVTNCFAQGAGFSVGADARSTLFQGENFVLHAGTKTYSSVFQGKEHEFGNAGYSFSSFVQGASHYITTSMYYNMLQGQLHTITATTSKNSFLQGSSHTLGAGATDDCFAQGELCTVDGARGFARGRRAHSKRDDQTTWGSDRLINGAAQSSHIVKYLQTANATPVAMVTLDLEEDKTYVISVLLTARNTDTPAESASFVITQATAYRDTAGAAVLISSPKSLTSENVGGDTTAWAAALASSGNNVLLNVIGDAADSVQWCADVKFVEVRG